MQKNALLRRYIKYVSQNILSMLGVSCYILADTYFISQAAGADGITALNLCLPVYSLIFALGAMLGVGASTRFAILRAQGERDAETYFSGAVFCALAVSVPFVLCGLFCPQWVLAVMGGDARIVAVGTPYARIFLRFAPFFMLNYVIGGFVRNDGDISLAMAGTLTGCGFNILFDYIFMFPMGMGLPGAALATGAAPGISALICSIHFLKKKNTVRFIRQRPRLRQMAAACTLGVAAFMGEFSSAVTTVVFNLLILRLAGNLGVAAYGIIANMALVVVAVFGGISQGAQPLVSECYGRSRHAECRTLLRWGVVTALTIAAVMVGTLVVFAAPITAIFNSEGSAALAALAEPGLRLYFTGAFFAGVNIVFSGWLSAANRPRAAAVCSFSRGLAASVGFALLLGGLFGMTGVWLAFPAAELATLCVTKWAAAREEAAQDASSE